MGAIDGVFFKELVTHADERGFFREVIRESDAFFTAGFGQLSHSFVNAGVLKAWHGHRRQAQWNYVITGLLRVALHDPRPGSPTQGQTQEFLAGEGQVVRVYMFPPGVLHGYRCLAAPMNILYVTSGVYDSEEEIRLAPDRSSIAFDW